MKHLLYSMACMAFFSCGNNDNTIDDPKPIDKDVYHFQFKDQQVKNRHLRNLTSIRIGNFIKNRPGSR